jgi:hypothetical protein
VQGFGRAQNTALSRDLSENPELPESEVHD